MANPLLPPPFLFHFAVPCRYVKTLWTENGARLDESYRLPHFGHLDGQPTWADLRLGWNEQGFAFRLEVHGKKQSPWCRSSRMEDSDGLHLLIDTRATHNIHRAGRFCHWLVFTPTGGGRGDAEPVAKWLPINRARELSRQSPPESLPVRSKLLRDGYVLEGAVLAAALTVFEPREQPRVGFTYMVADRELGAQGMTLQPNFPVLEDPSLWCDLVLA